MADTYAAKKYEELDFTDDFMFCKIMQNNQELCRELIELIIGRRIHLVTYPEKQKTIEITSDGKGIRLDIYVEDDEKNVYDVEMQTTKRHDLPKRARYYQGMIDLNLIERGAKYEELKKSYIIFICTFDCFGKGLHKYTFTHICEELPRLRLEDDTAIIFMCAGGTADDVSKDMKDFLEYLANREGKSKFTHAIEDAVEDARKHTEWRREFMSLWLRDQENQELGMELGKELGKELGQREKLKEQIQKKIVKGLNVDEIAEMLEESPKTIKELIEEIQKEK